jgi:hypothetical protein
VVTSGGGEIECIRQIGTELRGAFPDAAEHRIARLI